MRHALCFIRYNRTVFHIEIYYYSEKLYLLRNSWKNRKQINWKWEENWVDVSHKHTMYSFSHLDFVCSCVVSDIFSTAMPFVSPWICLDAVHHVQTIKQIPIQWTGASARELIVIEVRLRFRFSRIFCNVIRSQCFSCRIAMRRNVSYSYCGVIGRLHWYDFFALMELMTFSICLILTGWENETTTTVKSSCSRDTTISSVYFTHTAEKTNWKEHLLSHVVNETQ